MRIDAHLHVWEKKYPNRPYPWTPDPFPAEDLLPLLDEHEIDLAVHISPVMVGWDNSYGNLVAQRYPERFRVFGRFDPLQPYIEDALSSWMETPGAAGVRLTAFREGEARRLDDVDMERFWKAASDQGVAVSVFAPGRLRELVSVTESYPQLNLIIDHFGLGVYPGAENPLGGLNDLTVLADLPNVLLKVSGMPEVTGEPFPFIDLHPHLSWALKAFGADRMIWGSNWPVESNVCTYEEAYSWITESGVATTAEIDAVLGGTMKRVLQLVDTKLSKGSTHEC